MSMTIACGPDICCQIYAEPKPVGSVNIMQKRNGGVGLSGGDE